MDSGNLTFKTLDLIDKQSIESFTAGFSPYCDFSFTNLFIWNTDNDSSFYKFVNGCLVVKTYNLITQNPMYSLLGHSIDEEILDKLFQETRTIEFVPEECIDKKLAQNSKYLVTEDIDNHDYIVDLIQLKNLEGPGMKPVRQKLARFQRDFQTHLTVQLHPKHDHECLVKLFTKWRNSRDQNHINALENTESALKKLLKHAHDFNIQIIGIKSSENELLGFVINELTESDTAIGLFGFADNKVKGIYQALEYATSVSLVENGYKYINLEQDLGLQNLRKAKLEFQPVKLLKKFRIEKRIY